MKIEASKLWVNVFQCGDGPTIWESIFFTDRKEAIEERKKIIDQMQTDKFLGERYSKRTYEGCLYTITVASYIDLCEQ